MDDKHKRKNLYLFFNHNYNNSSKIINSDNRIKIV